MCGITGVFNCKNSVNIENFYKAHLKIRHRGPDDEGFLCNINNELQLLRGDDTIGAFHTRKHIKSIKQSSLVIGHRRLSILDLSSRGHQPQSYRDNYIVFNGEIYNYIEIREELKEFGYTFNSSSDTEVVLKAYHKWGPSCFSKFNGMWAMAIYDSQTNSVVLSRDRFGQKPLYFIIENDCLVFSSENKFIRKFYDDKFTVNDDYINDYINKGIADHNDSSAFEKISELEPGNYLKFDAGGISIKRFWDFEPSFKRFSEEDALSQFSTLFEDALKLRMRSDVEVGCLLSGGLDSSLIVCLLHALGYIEDNKFQTFSAVFEEKEYSEKRYMDLVQSKTNCKANFIYPKKEGIQDKMNTLLFHAEMPFRSLSFYSKYQIYQSVANDSNIKVALIGQGSDEAFGGYTADYYTAITSYLGSFQLKKASALIKFLLRERKISKKQILLSVLKRINPGILSSKYYNKATFDKITVTALREYLKNDDRNSMAHGIEVRSPFMDYRIMEFAFQLDLDHKINKKIVRTYSENIVPDEILKRKDKMGFVSPQEQWQQNYLKKYIISAYDDLRKYNTFLNMDAEKKLLDTYFKTKTNWQRVWRIYCYATWLKTLKGI